MGLATKIASVCVTLDETLGHYGFGASHPFGADRLTRFVHAMQQTGLDRRICRLPARQATTEEIQRFHSPDHVVHVQALSQAGSGWLDGGDTPAFTGVFEAAATVVGSVLEALERLLGGDCRHAFVPIAGLHHARRDAAAGFCVFNDCGVAIETLRRIYGIRRIAYVDIDAHHGDGVFYAYEADPELIIADLHQDGRTLYPGTGDSGESGRGPARGSKLNIPAPPGADDIFFFQAWSRMEAFLDAAAPEFIILQCGADSLAGDPLANLRFSAAAHAHAATRLCQLAERHGHGRLLALGGGGYNRRNLAAAWTAVVQAMLRHP